jgi:hypothetical protein
MKAMKVFLDAVKETPRLYFAPIRGMFEAAAKAQLSMTGETIGIRAKTMDSAKKVHFSVKARAAKQAASKSAHPKHLKK